MEFGRHYPGPAVHALLAIGVHGTAYDLSFSSPPLTAPVALKHDTDVLRTLGAITGIDLDLLGAGAEPRPTPLRTRLGAQTGICLTPLKDLASAAHFAFWANAAALIIADVQARPTASSAPPILALVRHLDTHPSDLALDVRDAAAACHDAALAGDLPTDAQQLDFAVPAHDMQTVQKHIRNNTQIYYHVATPKALCKTS